MYVYVICMILMVIKDGDDETLVEKYYALQKVECLL